MLMAPITCAIVLAQDQGLLAAGDPGGMAHMLFDLIYGPINRSRIAPDPQSALDGLCEERAFLQRFDAFLTLYAVDARPPCCSAK